ncbi:MAG: hypothetical protein ACYDHN_10500 [Solirubrobacteraceae bacterium]
MTWSRAGHLALLLCGVVLLVVGLMPGTGSGYIWAIGIGLTVGGVTRLFGWGYKFDPSKSGIQQWRERRRS